jgi:hypothetical protein
MLREQPNDGLLDKLVFDVGVHPNQRFSFLNQLSSQTAKLAGICYPQEGGLAGAEKALILATSRRMWSTAVVTPSDMSIYTIP